MIEIAYYACLAARAAADADEAERKRLKAMSPEDQDFEFQLRQTRALEEIARKNLQVNIKSSIF